MGLLSGGELRQGRTEDRNGRILFHRPVQSGIQPRHRADERRSRRQLLLSADGGRPPVQGRGRAGRGGTGADDRPERRVRPVEADRVYLFRSCGRHVSPRQSGQFRGRALCEPDRTQRYSRVEGSPGRPLRLFLCPDGRAAYAAYRSVVDAAVHRCRRRSLDRLGRLRPAGQRVAARRPPHERESLWTRRLGETCDDRLSL